MSLFNTTLPYILGADVACRNSAIGCLLRRHKTTIRYDKQIQLFTLQLYFPLPGQLSCTIIACYRHSSREEFSKAPFSTMSFDLFSYLSPRRLI